MAAGLPVVAGHIRASTKDMSEHSTASGGNAALSTLVDAAAATMRTLGKRLDSLIQSREEEFLALGARLMEYTTQSSAISDSAAELAALCAGDEIAQGTQRLESELAGLGAATGAEAVAQDVLALARTGDLIASLDQQIGEFGRIIRTLQMLGVSTRIESARLGDQGLGFSTLADDVEALAGKIVQDSGMIAEKSRGLATLVQTARGRTMALGQEQAREAQAMGGDIAEAFQTLTTLMEKAREVTEGITRRSRAVGASVAEVVASLQFHDIVRQQVEHVEEALRDMVEQAGQRACPEPGDSPGREPGDEEQVEKGRACWRDLVGWMADVSELQVSQLENASRRFGSAVQSLRDGLAGISGQAGELLSDLETITAAGDQGEGTVFARVARSTGRVVRAMERSGGQAREIAALIGEVAATVADMSRFVSSIEEVGSEIELIAINASIKAAHTGDEGKALGVLAQAIQRLSVEARDRTRGVAGVLRSVADVSRDLEGRATDTRQAEQLASYSESQERLSAVLAALDRDLAARMGDLARRCRALGTDVDALARSVDLDRRICPGLDTAGQELAGIVARCREAVPVADDAGRPERLKQLLSRYTMEVERVVHESAFGTGAGARALRHEDEGGVELFDDGSGAPAQNGEDWDNIELF